MKIFLLSFLISIPSLIFGQNSIDHLLRLVKENDIKSISNYISDNISISLHDKSGNYTKNQGEIILKDFFEAHKVNSLTVSEKRTQSTAHYAFGVMATQNGKFNLSVFMRFKKGTYYIQEIRIDSQK
jgi:hypothetical protein